ncbi:MAG TPA: hypothetical protein VIA18_05520 [Polyangia bacterium]|jgi:hypothetical protein|nr:hypothetical protein [Polyangia bacterium]
MATLHSTRRIGALKPITANRLAPRAVVRAQDPSAAPGRVAKDRGQSGRGALPASLVALQDTERRVAEEIRLGTIEAGAARIALEHLRRARLVLRVAVKGPVRVADEPAVEVTMCWLCGEAIVPERLADPADVVRHMATCAHAPPKPRRAR